jgi:hypothetical protein
VKSDGLPYGRFWVDGKDKYAHRVLYECTFGAIPPGLQLDHLCKNARCVNPDHLEVVTAQENLLRGNTIAAKNSKKTHCKRGHRLASGNLVRSVAKRGYRSCLTCYNDHQKRYRALRAAQREAASFLNFGGEVK